MDATGTIWRRYFGAKRPNVNSVLALLFQALLYAEVVVTWFIHASLLRDDLTILPCMY